MEVSMCQALISGFEALISDSKPLFPDSPCRTPRSCVMSTSMSDVAAMKCWGKKDNWEHSIPGSWLREIQLHKRVQEMKVPALCIILKFIDA
jgi:hypothetical protein